MGNINISTARTKAYAKEQRTMSNERYPKQTQSNPILSRRSPERSRMPYPLIRSGRAFLSPPRQKNSHFFLCDNLLPFCVESGGFYGSAPGRARTCNLRIRSPALYPVELRAPETLSAVDISIWCVCCQTLFPRESSFMSL